MDTIRAVFIGLEGERVHEQVMEYPPPAEVEMAVQRPLLEVWENGGVVSYRTVAYDLHPAHEIHDDGVESVALYIRRPEVET